MARTVHDLKRRCGWRKPGGCYLVSEAGINGMLPLITLLTPPIPLTMTQFRGYKTVDGDAILSKVPEKYWLTDSSKNYYFEKSWEQEIFGMSWNERQAWGICKKATTEQEGIELLSSIATWNKSVPSLIRDMSIAGLNSVSPLHFCLLVRQTQKLANTDEVEPEEILKFYATALRMLKNTREKKAVVRSFVIRLAVRLGFADDALGLAMQ